MLDVLTTLVLVAHLLCVNVAAGGPILCVWLEWRGGALARGAASYLATLSLAGLVAGGLLGFAVGWLKWTPEYRALWTGPLSYKLHWGGAELLFSVLLALGYWLLVRGRGGESPRARIGRGTLALLNGTNLLYHFPALFIVAGKLHAAGQDAGARIDGAAFRQLMVGQETPALTVHVGLASIAVAGAALLGLALRSMRRSDHANPFAPVATWGGRWALAASLAQLPVGLWTLVMLPADAQSRLLGSDALSTSLFLLSMLSALWLVRELAGVALGETDRAALVRSLAAMIVVVSLMTAMQQQTRRPLKALTSGQGATQDDHRAARDFWSVIHPDQWSGL
ncbi:MAG: hypothetical protein WD872_13535 [Pirellulaceae bacterium]